MPLTHPPIPTIPSPPPPAHLKVLCFGDSLTAGYSMFGLYFYPYATHLQAVLQAAFPATTIQTTVEGMSGAQVRGQYTGRLHRACRLAAAGAEPFDWVVVLGGTNDLGWGAGAEEVFGALGMGKGEGGYLSSGVIILYASIAISLISFRAMVLTEATEEVWNIALATGANVLALTVPEAAVRDASLVRRRDTLNALIEEHVAEGFYHMDLCHAVPYFGMEERKREAVWDDGLHLKAEGYKMMGDAIGAHLAELLPSLESMKNRKAAKVNDAGNEI
ncbi:hypothetical protein MMC34_005432 [Xylographa carneopallida]|nr:hypothetical protein [Xylographa carneopallida]